MVFKFLDACEAESCIWDTSDFGHKIRNNIHGARKSKETETGVSIPKLKKKKYSLMATYRSLALKVKSSKRTGTGRADVYQPTWFAFPRMSAFLGGKFESEHNCFSFKENRCSVLSPALIIILIDKVQEEYARLIRVSLIKIGKVFNTL